MMTMRPLKITNIIEIGYSPKSVADIKHYLPDSCIQDQRSAKTYYSKAIREKANISAIQISHWTKMRIIQPVKVAKGTGKMHLYSHQNLIEAMICRELSQYSITHSVMFEIIDFLRNTQWIFKIYLEADGLYDDLHAETKKNAVMKFLSDTNLTKPLVAKRHHTVWEYFRLYPQEYTLSLILWKNSPSIILSEPKTGDYNMYVTTDRLDEILARSPSSIVMNLTLLLKEAGSFFEEDES